MFDQETINALALLRTLHYADMDWKSAFDQLDNAGVFAALDEQTDYASAKDIMADAERDKARAVAREMFAGLLPGNTGANMANEVADKILSAVRNEQDRARHQGTDYGQALRDTGHLGLAAEHYRHDA